MAFTKRKRYAKNKCFAKKLDDLTNNVSTATTNIAMLEQIKANIEAEDHSLYNEDGSQDDLIKNVTQPGK